MTNISGNYTIQKGDCLWNIVKHNYTKNGESLSNSDIAGIVKKIADDNANIKDPNLIFTGDKIQLNDYDGFELQIAEETLDEVPKTVEEEPKTKAKEEEEPLQTEAKETKTQEEPEEEQEEETASTGLYDSFNSWASKNSSDFTGINITLSGTKRQEAFEEIEKRTFSYNTEETEESRQAGLQEMITSQIKKYDLDNNNAISLKEYLMGEVADYNESANGTIAEITEEMIDSYIDKDGKLTESEVNELLSGLERTFDFFNFNHNSSLDENELKAYYNILDTSVDGVQDGKFDFATYMYWVDLASAGEGDSLEASRAKRKSELDRSYEITHASEMD